MHQALANQVYQKLGLLSPKPQVKLVQWLLQAPHETANFVYSVLIVNLKQSNLQVE